MKFLKIRNNQRQNDSKAGKKVFSKIFGKYLSKIDFTLSNTENKTTWSNNFVVEFTFAFSGIYSIGLINTKFKFISLSGELLWKQRAGS